MKGALRVFAVLLTLMAFGCGFVGVAAGLNLTQPAAKGSTHIVQFQVVENDSASKIADRLQKDGLIRNSLAFWLLAKYKKLDAHLQQGTYALSPSMTMDDIVQTLLTGKIVQQRQVAINVPPGLRVTEYAALFTQNNTLPNFDATAFLRIATTGVEPDGTALSKKFWYVEPKQPKVLYALEGYLYPVKDNYLANATAADVVERLIADLGDTLCMGPDFAHRDAYIADEAQCKAHATMLTVGGKQVSIFTQMEKLFGTKDDARALYDTLILAPLDEREARHAGPMAGVASVYYNRYLAAAGVRLGPDNGGPITLDSDPTVQYATGTAQNPWPKLNNSARLIAPQSPYNTYTHPGLPPGPIAAPGINQYGIDAITNFLTAPTTTYYYFETDCTQGLIHYAHTLAEQQQNQVQYPPC